MKKRILGFILIGILVTINLNSVFANTHTVKPNDFLWKIAKRNGTTWQKLAKINQLDNPHLIYPGQILFLDEKDDDKEKTKKQYSYQVEQVTITSRGIEIPGTFVYPEGKVNKKVPLVVMAHGHGGNREEGGGFTKVSEELAINGVASIRIDFSGCGESTEPFTQNNLSNMLQDIEATLQFAIRKENIDSKSIGILGFSMGGRVAILSAARNPLYKTMALWSPAGTDGAHSIKPFLGGDESYSAMNEEANEKDFVNFTTAWGQAQELSKQWFEDMNTTKPLQEIQKYSGTVLILYGDKDDVIYPSVNKEIIDSLSKNVEVKEHIVKGGGHGLGFFSNDSMISDDAISTTVEFLTYTLK